MTRTTIALGALEGRESRGLEVYLGVPYATPPVGGRRFRPPEPATPWVGSRDATTFGASAWQPPPTPGSPLPGRDKRMDEDCLVLNVYTPRSDDAGRPVLFWIHGGAYTTGAGDLYDGRSFASIGDMVVVTINYRLGPFGFLDVGHLDPAFAGSFNNGIRDQIEALRWVRDHIADFGGDPGQVTICGESAGAGSVMALLAAPEARGLFHRAISQSAPAGFGPADPEFAARLTDAIDGDPFTVGAEALVAGHSHVAARSQQEGPVSLPDGNGGYHPVVDGDAIPLGAVDSVAGAGADAVPLLVGTNVHEGTLFGFGYPAEISDEQLRTAVAPYTDDPDRVIDAFREEWSGIDNRRLLIEMMTDTLFRTSSLAVADTQADAGAPVHVYRFSWESQGFGGALGATHALEIPFVWNMELGTWAALLGEGEPYPPNLAGDMHRAWIAYTRTGDPSHDGIGEWPRYDTTRRPTMDFGDATRVLDDPGGRTRACWG